MTKQHIPKIRFQRFDNEWENTILDKVLKERKFQQIPTETEPLVSFTVENGVTPKTERYNREFLVREDNKKYKFTKLDDIVYNPANLKFGAIAKNNYGNAVISPIYVTLEIFEENNSEFLEMLLTQDSFIQRALQYQEGTVYERMAVKVQDFLTLSVSLPSLPEQESIGQLFRTLDELISAYKENLEHYQSLKTSMLSKMFPKEGQKQPEIRLYGFEGDWEEKKLKDIAEFNPKSIIPNEFNYVDLESVIGTTLISHKRLSKDEAPSRAQRTAKKNDIFFQTVRPYQKNNFLFLLEENDWVFSTGYAQIRTKIDSSFLFVSLQRNSFVKDVLLNCTGTSYPAINSKDLSNLFISLPSLPEQEAIGAFFANLDETISSYQDKIGQLELLKKNLLSQMFI